MISARAITTSLAGLAATGAAIASMAAASPAAAATAHSSTGHHSAAAHTGHPSARFGTLNCATPTASPSKMTWSPGSTVAVAG
jgi:hypothetical protein